MAGGGGGLLAGEPARSELDADGTVSVVHAADAARAGPRDHPGPGRGRPARRARSSRCGSATATRRSPRSASRARVAAGRRRWRAVRSPTPPARCATRCSTSPPTCSRRRAKTSSIDDGAIHVAGVPSISVSYADVAAARPGRARCAATSPSTAARAVGRRPRTCAGSRSTSTSGPRAHRSLRRGRGLRRAHQPQRRRRSGERWRRAGHRRGALREVVLRRAGQLPGRHLHGLPAPDRGGGARRSRSTTWRRRPTSRSTTAASVRAG